MLLSHNKVINIYCIKQIRIKIFCISTNGHIFRKKAHTLHMEQIFPNLFSSHFQKNVTFSKCLSSNLLSKFHTETPAAIITFAPVRPLKRPDGKLNIYIPVILL